VYPDRLWNPLNGFWRLFPQRYRNWGVKLTIHLHLVPRLRMSGDILPPPNMPSQGAQGLYLFLPNYSVNNSLHTPSKCGMTVNTQLISMWKEAVII